LNGLFHVFIHRHISLVQLLEFLLLQLDGAAGHVVSSEMSLELILGDSFDIEVGVAVSLTQVCYGSKQLVRREKNVFMVGTLGYIQLILD
jgi:hypothetical protein